MTSLRIDPEFPSFQCSIKNPMKRLGNGKEFHGYLQRLISKPRIKHYDRLCKLQPKTIRRFPRCHYFRFSTPSFQQKWMVYTEIPGVSSKWIGFKLLWKPPYLMGKSMENRWFPVTIFPSTPEVFYVPTPAAAPVQRGRDRRWNCGRSPEVAWAWWQWWEYNGWTMGS